MPLLFVTKRSKFPTSVVPNVLCPTKIPVGCGCFRSNHICFVVFWAQWNSFAPCNAYLQGPNDIIGHKWCPLAIISAWPIKMSCALETVKPIKSTFNSSRPMKIILANGKPPNQSKSWRSLTANHNPSLNSWHVAVTCLNCGPIRSEYSPRSGSAIRSDPVL